MIASHTQSFCTSGDVELSYRLFGSTDAATRSRPPVLFVHGLSYFSYDWVDFGSSLCTDRMGCAMDMRGFGDSTDSPSQDYSVRTMARDIRQLLDHLGWERSVIVGHSMGGRISTTFAADNPDRVAGLVLVDWSPENAPQGTQRVAKVVAGTPGAFPSIEAAMSYFGADPHSPAGQGQRERFEAYLRPVPGGFEAKRSHFYRDQFRRMLESGEKSKHGVDLWEQLGKVRSPILLLRGTRSDMFAEHTATRMLEVNSRIRLQQIDAGHHIAGDNPQAALVAIRSFINSLQPA